MKMSIKMSARKQTVGQSDSGATGAPQTVELESKSVKELREICRDKGIDTVTCADKRDLVDLIISQKQRLGYGVQCLCRCRGSDNRGEAFQSGA